MSKRSLIIRSIAYCVLFSAYAVGSALLLLAAMFDRESGRDVYMPALFAIWFIGSVLLAFSFLVQLPARRLIVLWSIFLALNIVCHAPYHGYSYYKNTLTVVRSSMDMDAYIPFTDNKLARLDKPASLKFSVNDDLPILDGSTALYPLYAALAESIYPRDLPTPHNLASHPGGAYYPYSEGIVRCSRTNESYMRLIDGAVDIIFVPMASDEQLARAAEEAVELEFTPIGQEAFVFLVNTYNPVENLSSDELRDIYTGKITNWRELGGKSASIRAYQRNIGSGSQTAFLRFMNGREPIPALESEYFDVMSGVIEEVADYRNHRNALGYSFHFFVYNMAQNDGIKLIAVDGVTPDAINIASGRYPLVDNFYAVRVKGRVNANADRLIDWILSDEGQELVERTGYFRIAE